MYWMLNVNVVIDIFPIVFISPFAHVSMCLAECVVEQNVR